jgi:hypothetical protein
MRVPHAPLLRVGVFLAGAPCAPCLRVGVCARVWVPHAPTLRVGEMSRRLRALREKTSSFRAIRRLFAEGSGCHSERSEESLILWRVRVPHAPVLRVRVSGADGLGIYASMIVFFTAYRTNPMFETRLSNRGVRNQYSSVHIDQNVIMIHGRTLPFPL